MIRCAVYPLSEFPTGPQGRAMILLLFENVSSLLVLEITDLRIRGERSEKSRIFSKRFIDWRSVAETMSVVVRGFVIANQMALDAAIVDFATCGAEPRRRSGSVRPIAGNMDLHVELKKRLARFKHADTSVTYQTCFAANAGLIPQLAVPISS